MGIEQPFLPIQGIRWDDVLGDRTRGRTGARCDNPHDRIGDNAALLRTVETGDCLWQVSWFFLRR